MSSFYDESSLVLIPSGYKTSKIYAEKPTDGSGDLTFTRASGATRVASNGLIEKVRTNLALYSEDFTNAVWEAFGATTTVTANATTAPDGTTTADRVQIPSSSRGGKYQLFSATSGETYTFSCYLKASAPDTIRLFSDQSCGNFRGATIANVTTEWQRFEFTVTATATASITFGIDNEVSTVVECGSTGSTVDVFIWGFQAEISDFGATPYIPTTTAAVSVGPVSNVPRLDYLGSSCPRLLLEPQRTNVQTYSEQINNAAWGLSGVSVSANNAISPDGYTNADKIVESAANARHEFYGVSASFSGNNSVSFFAKAAGRRYICALEPTGAGGATFDLQTGTVATVTAVSASIENYGNGWYRCSVVINKTATTQIYYVLRTTSSVGIETYTGDGTSGVLFYGAQTELSASYATSYIPTTAASVTRVADAAYKTSISSLLSASVGTLFVEVERQGPSGADFENLIFISDTSLLNFVNIIYDTPTNRYKAQVREGATTSPYTGKIKIAAAWEANNLVLYINGVLQATDTSVTVPTVTFDSLALGSYYDGSYGPDSFRGSFSQALVFKNRLTNAQLAELTTL
jgi:Concanavalin A-like lectin/glucanases superfamily